MKSCRQHYQLRGWAAGIVGFVIIVVFPMMSCDRIGLGTDRRDAAAKVPVDQKPAYGITSTADVMKAFRKVDVAIEVGVGYERYMDLLIDAKAALNEARLVMLDPILPALQSVMDCYIDALRVWEHQLTHKATGIYTSESRWVSIIKKYSLPTDKTMFRKLGERVDIEEARRLMWARASSELANLTKSLMIEHRN